MELTRNDETVRHARMKKLIKTNKDDMTCMYLVQGLSKNQGRWSFSVPRNGNWEILVTEQLYIWLPLFMYLS